MKKICKVSGKEFEISEEDLKFYERIGVPPPTLCPDERCRRRWAWRGKDFFMRKCDKCDKKVMAWFSPRLDIITYCNECYRSDDFDATEYGCDYDFEKPFFEQFNELLRSTPRHISNAVQNENSEYIISAHKNRSCYFVDEIDESRDCYFGYNIQFCKNIVESIFVRDSEIGYDLAKAENCYSVFYSKNVFNCSNSAFLINCRSCKHCLFSANLRNKEYYVFNKQVSKEEFQSIWNDIFTGSRERIEQCRNKFDEFLKAQPTPHATIINCEDSTGDYLSNCKNVKDSFWIDNSRDCRFCSDIHYSKDCYDVNIYEGEMMYECTHVGPKGYGQLFSQLGWFSTNLQYCIEMHGCRDCFGCVSLKKKQYCIFNKQYSKDEYEKLYKKIVQHMHSTSEYGEFFPIEMSPYPYNQTMAQRFYPLTKEEAPKRGLKWADDENEFVGKSEEEVPENLIDIPSGITKKLFTCTQSGKKYRFSDAEIKFYQKYGIPLPTMSPIERIENMWRKMGFRKLSDKRCQKCNKLVKTALSDQVMCEECYLKKIK